MRTTLLIFLLLVFITSMIYSQDNELHAFTLDHHGIYPMKDLSDSPLYLNYNISSEATPQNEPSIRISRNDPDVVVAAWRDFRLGWEEPNVVRRIGYAWSHDGGLTWSESQLLPDPLPNHLSQSDPVLTSDSEGNFYLSSTSRQPVVNYNRDMLLYKSTDNGVTFQLHAVAVPGSGSQGEDKEWIFCDPVEENDTYDNIMMVWKSFGPIPKIKFSQSGPGGDSWGPSILVGDNYGGQGANVATGTNGTIYVVWWDTGVKFDRSLNGGSSFGTDTWISSYSSQYNTSFPFICVDYSDGPYRGNVYVVWADRRNGNDDIWFQRSTDHGDTWLTQPIMVNDVAVNQQYWPSIQCDENGRVVVVYYDEREGPGQMNAYLAYSDDEGDTWTNSRLSDLTFNGNTPNSNVRFGDYIHIDAYNGKIIPVWTDDRAGNYDQEIYTAVVEIPVSVAETVSGNETFTLYPNYPNPFSGSTTLKFATRERMQVSIMVYSSAGQLVGTPVDQMMDEGIHHYRWSGTELAPGIYTLKVLAGNSVSYLKMLHY